MRRKFTEAQKRIVAARYEWKCAACDQPLPAAFQVDHINPLWKGGPDTLDNAQPLDATCHAAKTQREGIERAARKRRLREQMMACTAHRPPFECLGCGRICSPYFAHRCP